jgi:hypothetical protein
MTSALPSGVGKVLLVLCGVKTNVLRANYIYSAPAQRPEYGQRHVLVEV